jgi:hypothetical protein
MLMKATGHGVLMLTDQLRHLQGQQFEVRKITVNIYG